MIKVDHDNPNFLQIEIGFEEMGGLQNMIIALDHDRGRLLLGELAEYYAALVQMTEEDFMDGPKMSRPEPQLPKVPWYRRIFGGKFR